jgi:hypothetical protein
MGAPLPARASVQQVAGSVHPILHPVAESDHQPEAAARVQARPAEGAGVDRQRGEARGSLYVHVGRWWNECAGRWCVRMADALGLAQARSVGDPTGSELRRFLLARIRFQCDAASGVTTTRWMQAGKLDSVSEADSVGRCSVGNGTAWTVTSRSILSWTRRPATSRTVSTRSGSTACLSTSVPVCAL